MKKITFPKNEIEKFLDLADYADVTNESVLNNNITEYILINIKNGLCKMTITSQKNFVTYLFSSNEDKCDFIISYFNLKKFFPSVKGNSISFIISETTDDSKKYIITDGKNKSEHQVDSDLNFDLFPKQPNISGIVPIKFERDLINKFIIAKKFIKPESKDRLLPWANVCSIKNNMLLATDVYISCMYLLDYSLEYIYLTPKEIALVNNFDSFDYTKTENWNVIKYKTIVFGSKIGEGILPGTIHETVYNYVSKLNKSLCIKINVQQFYDFCKLVKSYVKDETVNAELIISNENTISFNYLDKQNNVKLEGVADCKVVGYPNGFGFKFSTSAFSKALDGLKSDLINISEVDIVSEIDGMKHFIGFWLDSDSSFHSICCKGN